MLNGTKRKIVLSTIVLAIVVTLGIAHHLLSPVSRASNAQVSTAEDIHSFDETRLPQRDLFAFDESVLTDRQAASPTSQEPMPALNTTQSKTSLR